MENRVGRWNRAAVVGALAAASACASPDEGTGGEGARSPSGGTAGEAATSSLGGRTRDPALGTGGALGGRAPLGGGGVGSGGASSGGNSCPVLRADYQFEGCDRYFVGHCEGYEVVRDGFMRSGVFDDCYYSGGRLVGWSSYRVEGDPREGAARDGATPADPRSCGLIEVPTPPECVGRGGAGSGGTGATGSGGGPPLDGDVVCEVTNPAGTEGSGDDECHSRDPGARCCGVYGRQYHLKESCIEAADELIACHAFRPEELSVLQPSGWDGANCDMVSGRMPIDTCIVRPEPDGGETWYAIPHQPGVAPAKLRFLYSGCPEAATVCP